MVEASGAEAGGAKEGAERRSEERRTERRSDERRTRKRLEGLQREPWQGSKVVSERPWGGMHLSEVGIELR